MIQDDVQDPRARAADRGDRAEAVSAPIPPPLQTNGAARPEAIGPAAARWQGGDGDRGSSTTTGAGARARARGTRDIDQGMGRPIVLGVDPGFASFGVAAVELGEPDRIKAVTVLRTEKSARKLDVRASADNARRARELAAALTAQVEDWRPVALAAEAFSPVRSSSVAAKVGLAWGVLAAVAEAHKLPLLQASPQAIKLALCGNKSASKTEVIAAIELRFPEVEWPKSVTLWEHCADAAAAVVACSDSEAIRMARKIARSA